MRRVSFILMLVLITSIQFGCGSKKSANKSLPEAKYIKDSNKSVMLIQADKLFSSELGKLIPSGAMADNPYEVSEKEIERVVAGIGQISGQASPTGVAIVTLKSTADKAALKKKIEQGEAKEAHGKKYYDMKDGPGAVVYFDEEQGQLVMGPEEQVKEALSDAKASPLVDKISSNLSQHFYAFFDVASAKGAVDQFSGGPGGDAGPLAMVKGFIEPLMATKTLEIMIDLEGAELMHLHLDAGDADAAGKTNTALLQILGFAKMGVAGGAEKKGPPPMQAGMELAKEAVDSITVETHGTVVEVALPRPKDLVSRVKGLLPPQ